MSYCDTAIMLLCFISLGLLYRSLSSLPKETGNEEMIVNEWYEGFGDGWSAAKECFKKVWLVSILCSDSENDYAIIGGYWCKENAEKFSETYSKEYHYPIEDIMISSIEIEEMNPLKQIKKEMNKEGAKNG